MEAQEWEKFWFYDCEAESTRSNDGLATITKDICLAS